MQSPSCMHNSAAVIQEKSRPTHQHIEVQDEAQAKLARCHAISRLAILSLYKEATLYPKPGLVSPIDSGSHNDMDFRLFLASINSLGSYFFDIAALGMESASFEKMQQLGIKAEQVMMLATNGVNTHRGAIFNLGLMCAAAGHLHARNLPATPQALGRTISEQWSSSILASRLSFDAQSTHGQKVERRYGIHGARHEAVEGYPTVIKFGLPAYKAAFEKTQCHEHASIQALFTIMQKLNDTNILWRAGSDGLNYVQDAASQFLVSGGTQTNDWKKCAVSLHHEFIQRNLSPGGAADLLAVTFFCTRLTNEKTR